MVKRALCIGCNYPSHAQGLSGAVNDAFLIADCLQRSCGFHPDDICVLHDMLPGQQAKSSGRLVEAAKRPTRANILTRLQALVREASDGDVLFVSFAGYGLQVDDLAGQPDDGLDEALLPSDFAEGPDGEVAVILASDVQEMLMSVPPTCVVTVVMDCDHATSIVDVSGTEDGHFVQGLQLSTACGLDVHGSKMAPAVHDPRVWAEEAGLAARARPRFQPPLQVTNPRGGRAPSRTAMSRSTPQAFCYSAARHGQTAVEIQVSDVVDGRQTLQQHGALSWSFVNALEELSCDCTHSQLVKAVQTNVDKLREKHLSRMDQSVLLTFAQSNADPKKCKVFHLERALAPGASRGAGASRQAGLRTRRSASVSFPSVVPPPPPGFLGSGLSQASSFPRCSNSLDQSTLSHERTHASLAQPEEKQEQLAAAGVQLWRLLWNDFSGDDSLLDVDGAAQSARPEPRYIAAVAPPKREKMPSRVPCMVMEVGDEDVQVLTREPSTEEGSSSSRSSGAGESESSWEAVSSWASSLLWALGAPHCGLAAAPSASRLSMPPAAVLRGAMGMRCESRETSVVGYL